MSQPATEEDIAHVPLTQGRRDRRHFMGWCALGGGVSLLAFVWLLSAGTWDLTQPAFSSNFFDVQAQAFLHGKLSMPPSVLSIEGIAIHGRSYMYFGPALAILHLPFAWIAPTTSGRLTGLSMTGAFVIAMVALSQLLWRLRRLAGCDGKVTVGEGMVAAGCLVALSAGSVLLYLGSEASVYQETELWSVALALLALPVALDMLEAPTRRGVAWLALLCLSTCMVRFVVGLGVLALALLVALAHLASNALRDRHGRPTKILTSCGLLVEEGSTLSGIVLGASAALTLVVYAVVNEAKFHSPFGLPLKDQALAQDGLNARYASYAARHASFNDLHVLPTTLTWYLRPNALDVSRLFPFVNFPPRIWVVGSAEFAGLNPSSSLTATMPVLVILAVVGLVSLLAARFLVRTDDDASTVRHLRPLAMAMVIGCAGTLTYAGIAHRHLGDLYPALVLGAVLGGAMVLRWLRGHRVVAVLLSIIAVAGIAASIWINMGLGLINQRIAVPAVPQSERVDFARFRIDLFHSMFQGALPQVTRGGPIPKHAPLGWLYVTKGCTGLYQNAQGVWNGLERTASAGNHRLIVDLPSAPSTEVLPLLVSGSTPGSSDLFGVRVLPGHRFVIDYLSENLGVFFSHKVWATSAIQQAPPSGRIVLNLVIDGSPHAELRQAIASVDGRQILSRSLEVHSNTDQVVGRLPLALGDDPLVKRIVAPSFPGVIRKLPVVQTVCTMLERSGG